MADAKVIVNDMSALESLTALDAIRSTHFLMRNTAKRRLTPARKMTLQTYTPARCLTGSLWDGTKVVSATRENASTPSMQIQGSDYDRQ